MVAKKRHTPEQISAKLREAEVLLAKGAKMPQACRKLGAVELTYCRRRKEYGGVLTDRVKRLEELEKENACLAASIIPGRVTSRTRRMPGQAALRLDRRGDVAAAVDGPLNLLGSSKAERIRSRIEVQSIP